MERSAYAATPTRAQHKRPCFACHDDDDELERMTGLPLGNYHLTKGQVDAITECRFDLPAAR